MASARFLLCISVVCVALMRAASQNITSYRVPAGAKVALCGYYTLSYEMWANSTSAYLYVTDTACTPTTGTPCLPPTSPALLRLSCMERTTCAGQTGQPSILPLCLVVLNKNGEGFLEVNLLVSGSFAPVSAGGGSSVSSTGLSDFEIVLISVGSAAGFVIVAGLTALVVWLKCCKPPPRPQALDATPGAGDWGSKSVMMAAPMGPSSGGLQAMAAPQPLLSPATVYPYPQYGGSRFGMMQVMTPYGSVAPPYSPYGGVRSPSALAPLPSQAYSALSQPPSTPPPLLVLPPLPPPRKAAAAVPVPPPQSLPPQPQPPPPSAPTAQQPGNLAPAFTAT